MPTNDFLPYLQHHEILGQKWGARRYQNKDGSYTALGKRRQLITNQRTLKKLDKYDRRVETAAQKGNVNAERKYGQKIEQTINSRFAKDTSKQLNALDFQKGEVLRQSPDAAEKYTKEYDKQIQNILRKVKSAGGSVTTTSITRSNTTTNGMSAIAGLGGVALLGLPGIAAATISRDVVRNKYGTRGTQYTVRV